jgi:hypothetical protein
MLEAISRILGRCGSASSVLPPTVLFNEGWMLRLVLDWLDRNRQVEHPLSFRAGARWYSEALLPSRFLPQTRGDSRAESFTHPDGVVDHFTIAPGERGEAKLLPGVKQFVVAEEKLGSGLSARTTNAPGYDQAARNVACMAYMLGKEGIDPSAVDRLAFYVVAPDDQIKSGVFADLVFKESIEKKVKERIRSYEGAHDAWFQGTFLPTLARIELGILSWEEVLAALPNTKETELMSEFYEQCLRFKPLRARRAV